MFGLKRNRLLFAVVVFQQYFHAALRLAKRAVRAARGLPPAEAHRELERIYLDELMGTHDAHEGLAAFLAKRPPEWRHR